MKKSSFRILGLVLLPIVFLVGCGGGGGGGSAAVTTFNLDDPALAQVGGTLTFNLTGSANDGTNLRAVFSLARRPDTTFNGQAVRQLDQLVTITDTGTGQTDSASITSYTDAQGNFIYSINNDNGVEGFPNGAQTPLPDQASIGDFGALGDAFYSDGSETTQNWRLDRHPGSSTRGDLTFFVSFVSPTDLNYDSQLIRTIDSSGHTVDLSLSYFFENGLTVDLST